METEKKIVMFVANDAANFTHHRKHLVDGVLERNMKPILLSGGTGYFPDPACAHKLIVLNRYNLHWSDLGVFFLILRQILGDRPKALHLINLKPYLFGGLAAQFARLFGWRGKLVVSVPGLGRLYDDAHATRRVKLRRKIVETGLRLAVRNATVCFETASDRDFWVKQGLIPKDATLVTNGVGVDVAKFNSTARLGYQGKIRVLYAGRLLRPKGVDVFLRAAELNTNLDVEMLVAGALEADPDAIPANLLVNNSKILFLGEVTDMPALLSQTDIVVLPTRYSEGVPRILLEAAACGCVPIATLFPGSEVLIEDGKTGYFLRSEVHEGLAHELLSIIGQIHGNPTTLNSVGASAAAHVRENGFSTEDIKKIFMEIYITDPE